ncbi:MAG TPA: anaerobic ribonucleoside-triphosphate reductase [Spirochaetota bacterium]|jgi:ribonucleoside-triphosphate reductase|nr:hypothetical protein [Spirochaetota bacterium]HOA08011.1 anaerobic ribonucleoside-triphosphate reductase [Spirochaetota bacterium]HOH37970.1 anaerobic ribonucleoside-triphosphate reductase [Spirochaetota bacterium]HPA64339.1 anaerobic ribonucleoside-triphosphate reductase [Spirochaetota bacterium]HPJ14597.1 anaerobic ribonucleoside-triphosphate reductase [Spirochaetota bacterium]
MNNRRVPAEVYSRVVGYFRPVEQWNDGKKEEFKDRRTFNPEEINARVREESLVRI